MVLSRHTETRFSVSLSDTKRRSPSDSLLELSERATVAVKNRYTRVPRTLVGTMGPLLIAAMVIACSESDPDDTERGTSGGGGEGASSTTGSGGSQNGGQASAGANSGGRAGIPDEPPDDQLEKGPGPDQWVSDVWKRFAEEGPVGDNVGDFSYAGYRMGEEGIPDITEVVKAVDHGVIADDGKDDTLAIEAAIAAAHDAGGGAVLLPAGRLDVGEVIDEEKGTNRGIMIPHSNIVLRGHGSGAGGTIIHLTHPVPNSAALYIRGERWPGGLYGKSTSAISRGDFEFDVTDTSTLSPGAKVRLEISVPEGDTSLAEAMVAPFELDEVDHKSTYTQREMDWFAEVEEVVSVTRVRLAQPFRIDVPADWTVKLFDHSYIEEIGIEDLRIDTDWPGGYQHHKDFGEPGDPDYRTAKEQDYHWPGVRIQYAWDGWIRNVVLANANWAIDFRASKGFTVLETASEGLPSHTFLSFGCTDCLALSPVVRAPAVHPFYHAYRASGNVVTGAVLDFEPHPESGGQLSLDYHGVFPYENLCEEIRDGYVTSGGAPDQLPHAGIRHVFWDVRAPAEGLYENEFFKTWASTSSGNPSGTHAFEHHPQAFVVGVHRAGDKEVVVQQSSEDRADEWLTIEGLNQPNVFPSSLYGAQLELRLKQ